MRRRGEIESRHGEHRSRETPFAQAIIRVRRLVVVEVAKPTPKEQLRVRRWDNLQTKLRRMLRSQQMKHNASQFVSCGRDRRWLG
jgi:hypothetical protein